jgi:phosphoserine phosphatase RsbU/P
MSEHNFNTYKKLRQKDFKLNTLLEVTKAINTNTKAPALFSLFEHILRHELNIGRALLYSNNGEKWDCKIKYGVSANEELIHIDNELLNIKQITLIETESLRHLKHFDIIIPVYHKSYPLAYILLGDLNEQALKISPIIKHMPFIQTLANIIIVAVENKRLVKENIKQERIKKELELASEMQALLFPSQLPDNYVMQVAGFYKPHEKVGGDYYDCIKIDEENYIFCMADVSGKGVSAALLMANFQANLRVLAPIRNSLTELVAELNAKVNSSAKGEKFITMFIAKYNHKNRELSYINAAHNPPILLNNNYFEELNTGCTGLGMFDTIPVINEGKVTVDKNAVLLCYTDGVVELENESGEHFETIRLKEFLNSNKDKTMQEINTHLISSLEFFKGDKQYVDDIALFSCRFR